VSPLSTELWQIGLAPGRAELARLSRGLRRRALIGESARDCQPGAGEPPWAAALAALSELLGEAPASRAEAQVVVSNHFVRYLVVPWDQALLAPGEAAAAAVQRFERVHGEAAQRWQIRLSQREYGKPGLACAIDAGLLAAIRECLGAAGAGGIRLVSVTPLLVRAFNALRTSIDGNGVLTVVEPACVTVAVFREGGWHAVQTRHLGRLPAARVVEQELALATADVQPARVELLELGADCEWIPDEFLAVERHPAPAGACRLARVGSA
jgi:hypothetical protein